MTQSKHTPTPWRTFTGDKKRIVDEYGNRIVSTVTDHSAAVHGTTPEANAAFIIRCVNNHEALNAHAVSNSTIYSEERLRACDKKVLIALLGVIRNQALAAAKGDA